MLVSITKSDEQSPPRNATGSRHLGQETLRIASAHTKTATRGAISQLYRKALREPAWAKRSRGLPRPPPPDPEEGRKRASLTPRGGMQGPGVAFREALRATAEGLKSPNIRATPGGYGGKPPGVAIIGVPTGARNAGSDAPTGDQSIDMNRTRKHPPVCQDPITTRSRERA